MSPVYLFRLALLGFALIYTTTIFFLDHCSSTIQYLFLMNKKISYPKRAHILVKEIENKWVNQYMQAYIFSDDDNIIEVRPFVTGRLIQCQYGVYRWERRPDMGRLVNRQKVMKIRIVIVVEGNHDLKMFVVLRHFKRNIY